MGVFCHAMRGTDYHDARSFSLSPSSFFLLFEDSKDNEEASAAIHWLRAIFFPLLLLLAVIKILLPLFAASQMPMTEFHAESSNVLVPFSAHSELKGSPIPVQAQPLQRMQLPKKRYSGSFRSRSLSHQYMVVAITR